MNLLILAGGKGTRFKSSTPKALARVRGEPNLLNTIRKTKPYFSKSYIVVNAEQEPVFRSLLKASSEHVEILPLENSSGLGSGHGVMETIRSLQDLDEFVILWGDTFIDDASIVHELIAYKSDAPLILPVRPVSHPYVRIIVDADLHAIRVDFAKYGETHQDGYQDSCLFKTRRNILEIMELFHCATWKGNRYITETGEFEFLYIIHLMHSLRCAAKCFVTKYPHAIFTYNSVEELQRFEESPSSG